MNIECFVYILPQADVAAHQKNVFLIEHGPGGPPILSELDSVRQAVSRLNEIREMSPETTIIIDTATQTGREILYRSKHLLGTFHHGYDTGMCLCQLFYTVEKKMPGRSHQEIRKFLDRTIPLLFSARSLGGCRPCMVGDVIVAETAVLRPGKILPAQTIEQLYDHPIAAVPRFFAQKAKETLAVGFFNDKRVHEDIVALTLNIARVRQSPFPAANDNWFFISDAVENQAIRQSRIDDFICSVLSDTITNRKTVLQNHPIQGEIVRYVDRFFTAISIPSCRIFSDRIAFNRYTRIRSFMELILEYWSLELYRDTEVKPQIVDLSILRDSVRTEFEQFMTAV